MHCRLFRIKIWCMDVPRLPWGCTHVWPNGIMRPVHSICARCFNATNMQRGLCLKPCIRHTCEWNIFWVDLGTKYLHSFIFQLWKIWSRETTFKLNFSERMNAMDLNNTIQHSKCASHPCALRIHVLCACTYSSFVQEQLMFHLNQGAC